MGLEVWEFRSWGFTRFRSCGSKHLGVWGVGASGVLRLRLLGVQACSSLFKHCPSLGFRV